MVDVNNNFDYHHFALSSTLCLLFQRLVKVDYVDDPWSIVTWGKVLSPFIGCGMHVITTKFEVGVE